MNEYRSTLVKLLVEPNGELKELSVYREKGFMIAKAEEKIKLQEVIKVLLITYPKELKQICYDNPKKDSVFFQELKEVMIQLEKEVKEISRIIQQVGAI